MCLWVYCTIGWGSGIVIFFILVKLLYCIVLQNCVCVCGYIFHFGIWIHMQRRQLLLVVYFQQKNGQVRAKNETMKHDRRIVQTNSVPGNNENTYRSSLAPD